MEDYTSKYIGEHVELWLYGGEPSQEGTLTAFCIVGDVQHVELNSHILVPLVNVAGLHCISRCDSPGKSTGLRRRSVTISTNSTADNGRLVAAVFAPTSSAVRMPQ